MNWADSKHTVNSGKPHVGNPDPSVRNTRQGRETRHGATICCAKCSTTKAPDQFYKKNREGRLDTTCKACRIIDQRQKTLGVSEEDYRRMYTHQHGKCGICHTRLYSKRYKAFAVDHDHATGRIRGLLCGQCNLALGGFKDSVECLMNAIEWLKV